MDHNHRDNHSDHGQPNRSVNWTYWIVLCGFGAFALLLLLGEHRTHLLGLLPFLILLACPFPHIFMHKGHGSHSGHQPHGDADQRGGNRHEP